jgi:hypothetical protein
MAIKEEDKDSGKPAAESVCGTSLDKFVLL